MLVSNGVSHLLLVLHILLNLNQKLLSLLFWLLPCLDYRWATRSQTKTMSECKVISMGNWLLRWVEQWSSPETDLEWLWSPGGRVSSNFEGNSSFWYYFLTWETWLLSSGIPPPDGNARMTKTLLCHTKQQNISRDKQDHHRSHHVFPITNTKISSPS